MAHEDGEIYWHDPDPRAILPLNDFHLPRRLRRALRTNPFEIRIDTAFRDVINACAAPARKREQTWISSEIAGAFVELYEAGYAHSVESWQGDSLVGGLYGVSIGGFFAGESMFGRESNASSAALLGLVRRLRLKKFQLLDIQFMTDHFRRLGAIEVSRARYRHLLGSALVADTTFTDKSPVTGVSSAGQNHASGESTSVDGG